MADDRNRFSVGEEPLHELHGSRIHTQPVRIHDTAGQQERVVLVRVRLIERAVDGNLLAPFPVLPAADPSRLERDDVHFRASVLERLARPGQLVLFEPVRGKRGHTLPLQLISHEHLRETHEGRSSGMP